MASDAVDAVAVAFPPSGCPKHRIAVFSFRAPHELAAGMLGPAQDPTRGGGMARFDGTVALVSGGARGMGAQHVRALVAEGAQVVLGDLLDEEGRTLEAELGPATATSTST
jgi:hypothetical protein